MRLVAEQRDQYPSEFETIRSVAAKLGIGSAETLRKWVRRHPSHHRNGDTLNLCNSGQAIVVGQGRRRAPEPGGQIPGKTPCEGVRRFMSHVRAERPPPTLPASPRPATTNTYRRFSFNTSGRRAWRNSNGLTWSQLDLDA